MKKNLSYREKLLELSNIYKITEIQNYIKRKKNLTTHQIEHILKKNNVPIPKDFNISFFKKVFRILFQKQERELPGFTVIRPKVLEDSSKNKKEEPQGYMMTLLVV